MERMTEARLRRLLGRYGFGSHAHLYFLGDKEWFWDSKRESLIAYRSIGNRRIALGDPIGSPHSKKRAAQQFIADCRNKQCLPVFYQAKTDMLPVYRELGLRCAKIGEEAIICIVNIKLNHADLLRLYSRVQVCFTYIY